MLILQFGAFWGTNMNLEQDRSNILCSHYYSNYLDLTGDLRTRKCTTLVFNLDYGKSGHQKWHGKLIFPSAFKMARNLLSLLYRVRSPCWNIRRLTNARLFDQPLMPVV